ncbi:MAG: protein-export chaperone SecB [Nevskia sp.]
MSTPDPVPQADAAAPARQVFMQRIYLKDASLEMPKAPLIFAKEVAPQVDVQVGTAIDPLSPNQFQVVLQVTVTAKIGEDTAFLCEVHQAGIFHLSNFGHESEVQGVLAAYCPGVLLPFAREAIANLVQRTGYPAVMLQPINFEALYVEHLNRQRAEAAAAAGNGAVATVQ